MIHPNQAAFVKGVTIDEVIRFLLDVLDYAKQNDDFQKAFDSIEHL